jgi:hypothetical protein
MRPLILAVTLYAAWTAATYLLEGRPRTLLSPEATGLRIVYTLVANLLFGLGGAALLLGWLGGAHRVAPSAAGFQPRRRAGAMILVGLVAGAVVYAAQAPAWRSPTVLVNGFLQVLPVSAAEVVVCWSVTSAAIGAAWPSLEAKRARAIGLVPGALLFGMYHIAHSPPFNTPGMIAMLTAVGVVTGLVFLLTADVYASVAFHSFLGLHGVLDALDDSGRLEPYGHWQAHLVLMAAVTLAALVGVHAAARRARQAGGQA